jgi:hypothetical protein
MIAPNPMRIEIRAKTAIGASFIAHPTIIMEIS